jgi:hypothetical protein
MQPEKSFTLWLFQRHIFYVENVFLNERKHVISSAPSYLATPLCCPHNSSKLNNNTYIRYQKITIIDMIKYSIQNFSSPYCHHRYLITRLSLKVVYLWRHVSSTAPPFILWWWYLETLFAPPQPQLSLHRRAALSSDSNGTRSYIAERTQSAVYIVRCLWLSRWLKT